MKAKLIKTEVNYILEDDKGVVIASTSLKKDGLALSLKNCQSIERGYDLDELAYEFSWNYQSDPNYGDTIHVFKEGFQKALEVNADKRFTLKEMVECWNRALEFQTHKKTLGEYIKSLRQTEWEVEIEMQKHLEGYEMIGHQKGVYGSGNRIPIYNSKPKLDADGCLILKLKSE